MKDSSQVRAQLLELRETGLTSSQLARLFGVPVRSWSNWMSEAQQITLHQQERLNRLILATRSLAGSSPTEKQAQLLDSSHGESLFHQLLKEVKSDAELQVNPVQPRNML